MYSILIHAYLCLIRIAALAGHTKARKLLRGQRSISSALTGVDRSRPYIWCHAASAGEFEQGKPLIDAIHQAHPNHLILLTFFSPSGFETKKDYPHAHIVTYLPFDTPARVNRFLNAVPIAAAIFIKYDIWPNCLRALHQRNIPTFLVSAVFRRDQLFFHRFAKPYANLLLRFSHIFVQDQDSKALLSKIGVEQVTVAGDIRFDRVTEILHTPTHIQPAHQLRANAHGSRVLVAGSTWPPDEDILIPYFNEHPELFLILAPHEFDADRLDRLQKRISRPCVRLSQALTNPLAADSAHCLLVDNFGFLSSLYRYADIAFVGGGFSHGIHNTLEPAVFGIPVFFGPNYSRFREAKELVACGGAFPILDIAHLNDRLTKLIANDHVLHRLGLAASNYVLQNTGATNRVLNGLQIP
jgi:3-deoxy-D-manno-octulosonic-acid transferase